MPTDLWIELIDYLQSGGGVMLPIIAVSIWMWVLILKKFGEFHTHTRREIPLARVLDRIDRNPIGAAPWQEEILTGFLQERSGQKDLDRKILDRLLIRQEDRAEQHIKTILILAAAAPLLGLLGTVTGMIFTFHVITQFGTGNARALASGISEALITTQSGLMAAVPGLFMGNILGRRAEKLQDRMNRFCLRLPRALDLRAGSDR